MHEHRDLQGRCSCEENSVPNMAGLVWSDCKKGDSVLIPDEEETSAKGEQEVEKNQKAASSNGKKESLTGYGVGWPLSESTSVND